MTAGKITRLACAAAASALALAACGENTVSQDQLEKRVKELLAQQTSVEPKSVDCPGDLKAEKGEETTCTLTMKDGSKVKATVTVTSVEGDKANISVKAANNQ